MIRRTTLFIALTGLVMLLAVACSSDDDPVGGGFRAAGTINGQVWNVASDEPLIGATVMITSNPFATDLTETGEIVITTTTDADGRFSRADIPNGSIEVHVSKDGFVTPDEQYWALSPGGAGSFFFEMAPGEDPIPEFEGDEQSARPPDWSDDPGYDG